MPLNVQTERQAANQNRTVQRCAGNVLDNPSGVAGLEHFADWRNKVRVIATVFYYVPRHRKPLTRWACVNCVELVPVRGQVLNCIGPVKLKRIPWLIRQVNAHDLEPASMVAHRRPTG